MAAEQGRQPRETRQDGECDMTVAGAGDGQTARAAAIMLCGMLLIPAGDAFAKLITMAGPYSGGATAWARFVVGIAIVAPIVLSTINLRGLSARFYVAQAIRGVLLAGTIGFILTGARVAPLADVFGAFFIGPLIATLLARLVLREEVRRFEWGAVAIGFVGVLMVVRPSAEMNPGLLWALAGGACYGTFLAATRWAAGVGPPLAQLLGQMTVGALVLTPIAAPEFLEHGVVHAGWLFGSGLCSALANLLTIIALASARAAVLSPLVYTQLISAAGLSCVVFADVLDPIAAVGLLVIAAAGFGRFADPSLWRRAR